MKRLIAIWLARKIVPHVWIVVTLFLLLGAAFVAKPGTWAAPVLHSPNQTVPGFPFDTRFPWLALEPTPLPTATPVIPPDFPPACFPAVCRLTGNNVNHYPVWSPDGRTITYLGDLACIMAQESRSQEDTDSIYQVFADGSHQISLKDFCGITMEWSRAGTKLVVSSSYGGMAILNADLSGQINIQVGVPYIFFPHWSPDGSKILFGAKECCVDTYDLYTVDAAGNQPAKLFSGANYFVTPSWSPDGAKILFGVADHDTNEIYTINADGSNPTKLIGNTAIGSLVTWSPTGSKILFVSVQDGNKEIYAMNADGSHPANLSNDPDVDEFPQWSPNGNQIAFRHSNDTASTLYVMNADGSNAIPVIDTFDSRYQWSPDSSKLVTSADRLLAADMAASPGPPAYLYVTKADGTQSLVLFGTQADGYIHNATWSPSGKHVVFDSNGSIYVVGVPQ